ncbi:MAG: stage 0 sporulation family protein [Candidatus Omnitrophota bacterium]
MHEVVMVKMGDSGKVSYYDTGGIPSLTGDYVIIEVENGLDYGEVLSERQIVLDADVEKPLRKIVRLANEKDLTQIQENEKKIDDIFKICEEKIKERNLSMKLVDAEHSFDRSKIIFHFTADGRVDFRELVKDLARIFKARIELKQIGVRDEAKRLGGFGHCGCQLCCAKFLKDFEPVTIKMAKDQNLPLNPSKISGVCGRLMCCLGFEHVIYKKYSKGLPKEGQTIKTKEGAGKVISVNILKRKAVIELENERQIEIHFPLKGEEPLLYDKEKKQKNAGGGKSVE